MKRAKALFLCYYISIGECKINRRLVEIFDVDQKYIEKLHKADKEVRYNKQSVRPYLFTKIEVESGKKYLVPLSSQKTNKARYKDITEAIYDPTDLTRILRYLEYHKMIPYHESIATRINFNDIDNYNYRSLLMKDYR